MNKFNYRSLNPVVDRYIIDSAEFARPVLEYIRFVVHKNCPEVEETIKWNFPHFIYKSKILCSMASFKSHCALTFWNSRFMDDKGILEKSDRTAMGHLGKIGSVEDLPEYEIFAELILEAKKCIDEGKSITKPEAKPVKEFDTPELFTGALKKDPIAAANFKKFSPSKRKEYLEWFAEAKTETTLAKRIQTALEWIGSGKSRNWKYEKK